MQASSTQGFGTQWMVRQQLGEPGEVITFYSYKGGTGRTMGLVNCAGLIAQQLPSEAKTLLLIDFDLEAPGLHSYLAPCLNGYNPKQQQGVLDLFEALEAAVNSQLAERRIEALDDESVAALVCRFDLSPFLMPVQLPSSDPHSAPTLQFMPAGRFDERYDARIEGFRWPQLYARAPALFRALSARLAAEHSFVFVDARTGLSDTSGICTMLLPDALVVVFTPNSQSLTGIEHLVRKAVDYRARSPDLRRLRVYPLPSRVDNQVEHFRQVWRMGEQAHPLFGSVAGYQPLFIDIFGQTLAGNEPELATRIGEYFDQVQIPHAADYAFGERLCFAQHSSADSLSIRGSYESFLPWLVTGAHPWERPAEQLNDLRAALWLRDAGVDESPADAQGWDAWFDRVARMVTTANQFDLTPTALSSDRRFDIEMARSLGLAHVGDYVPARTALEVAAAVFDDDSFPSISRQAPAELLRMMADDPPASDLVGMAVLWLESLDELMTRWHPLKGERRLWLEAVLPLARKWEATELCWRVTAELEGQDSPSALQAQLATARVRQRAGNLTGALALVDPLVDNQEPDIASSALELRTSLMAERTANEVRLPTIADCDSTAWVSTASGDDKTWPEWIPQFVSELERGLRASLRSVKFPPIVAAANNDLPTPHLETISRRLGRTFAFILVAGPQAASSQWCQRETQIFLQMYGPKALQRLYIVALTESALNEVLAWPVWNDVDTVLDGMALRFYSDEDRNQPVTMFVNQGFVRLSEEFLSPFIALRDSLAHSLRASAAPALAAAPQLHGGARLGTVVVGGELNVVATQSIHNSVNIVAGTNAPLPLRVALGNLAEKVVELARRLSPERAEAASKDLATLTSEAVSRVPRKLLCDLSAAGLREAAKTVPAMAKPVVEALDAVLLLLRDGFEAR